MTYLFLGGPWNGQWHEVGDNHPVTFVTIKNELYTPRSFHLDWGQAHAAFYALDTLTDMEAFTMLLEGYGGK